MVQSEKWGWKLHGIVQCCRISLTIFHLFYDFIWSKLTYVTLLSSLPSQLTVLPYAIYCVLAVWEN